MADKLYAFAQPVLKFLSIVGAIAFIVWSGLRWFWKWQENILLKQFRIEEIEMQNAS